MTWYTCVHVGPALLRSLISVGSSKTQDFYNIVSIRRSASLVQLEGGLTLCGSVFLFLVFFALLPNITFLMLVDLSCPVLFLTPCIMDHFLWNLCIK